MAYQTYKQFYGKDWIFAKTITEREETEMPLILKAINQEKRSDLMENLKSKFRLIGSRNIDIEAAFNIVILKEKKHIDTLFTDNRFFGTLLAFAINNINHSLIKKLIDKGANVNFEYLMGYCPYRFELNFFSVNYLISIYRQFSYKFYKIYSNNKCERSYVILKTLLENGLELNILTFKKLLGCDIGFVKIYHNNIIGIRLLIGRMPIAKVLRKLIFDFIFNKDVIELLSRYV